MISFLKGTVAGLGDGYCLLEVGGVGYKLAMSTSSLSALPAEGDEVIVHTHLHVREDELSLFGFESETEKRAFEQLITVSGVGPKVALATLSSLTADELSVAVATGDVATISGVPGIGKKTAQRIILDLADKLSSLGTSTPSGQGQDAGATAAETLEALLAMGFSAAEAAAALKGFDGDPGDSSSLLKHALKRLGGGL